MGAGNSGLFKNTQGSLKPEHLMSELEKSGVKFTKKEVIMVTKTKRNELVWLEKGNNSAGLQHIIKRHEGDLLKKFNINRSDIPSFIKEIFSKGTEISSKVKNGGFEKRYRFKNEYFVISGVGKNGYIITVYPDPKGGK